MRADNPFAQKQLTKISKAGEVKMASIKNPEDLKWNERFGKKPETAADNASKAGEEHPAGEGKTEMRNMIEIKEMRSLDDRPDYSQNSRLPEAGQAQTLRLQYLFQKLIKDAVAANNKEMADQLALDLVEKGMVTDQLILTIGYDRENLTDPKIRQSYHGPVTTDHYGRKVPKHAHGTVNLPRRNSSAKWLTDAALELFDQITDRGLLIRRIGLGANRIVPESAASEQEEFRQLSMFIDEELLEKQRRKEDAFLKKEKQLQQALLSVKKKYGKNAVLKGLSFEDGATARERNRQIGGHKA